MSVCFFVLLNHVQMAEGIGVKFGTGVDKGYFLSHGTAGEGAGRSQLQILKVVSPKSAHTLSIYQTSSKSRLPPFESS